MSAAEETIATLRDSGSDVTAVSAVMLSAASISVALRFLAKSTKEHTFGWDDFLIACGLACYLTSESLVLRGIYEGSQATDGNSPGYLAFLLLTWIYSVMYWSTIAFTTFSILFLYRRVFSAHRFFAITSNILFLIVIIWWISGTICDAISWQPTSSYWDGSGAGQYILNYNDFWIVSMVAELVIEATIIVLPVREITKLNLSKRKKAFMVSMFCMGGLVLITGALRIHYAWASSDMIPGTVWLCVHSGVSIISACLPTYRPLFGKVSAIFPSTRRGSSYADSTYKMYSKGSRRTAPTAEGNLRHAASFDQALLQQPEQAELTLNGLSRKLSIPSPDRSDSTDHSDETLAVPTETGTPTKRDDFND